MSRKKDWLFRRLFQLVRTGTEILVHRLPVEIGPSAPSSSLCVVAGASGEAGTFVPITHFLCASLRVAQSGKIDLVPVDNGDIAHNLRICAVALLFS